MRKPLSAAAKYKIKLFTVYISALVFCIFWLTAEVDITRRVKQDRLTSTSCLSVAERGISDYADGLDPLGMETAGERLLEFYSISKRNSESKTVLIAFRRGYPKLTPRQLSDIGAAASSMMQHPELMAKYADDLVRAIRMMSDDVDSKSKRISPEAAEVFEKIREERSLSSE